MKERLIRGSDFFSESLRSVDFSFSCWISLVSLGSNLFVLNLLRGFVAIIQLVFVRLIFIFSKFVAYFCTIFFSLARMSLLSRMSAAIDRISSRLLGMCFECAL